MNDKKMINAILNKLEPIEAIEKIEKLLNKYDKTMYNPENGGSKSLFEVLSMLSDIYNKKN